jgi:hypothetical protein
MGNPFSFLEWWDHKKHTKFRRDIMAKLQAILDAQADLDTKITALSAKVDAQLEATKGSASPAEQAEIAAGMQSSATAVDAIAAKL